MGSVRFRLWITYRPNRPTGDRNEQSGGGGRCTSNLPAATTKQADDGLGEGPHPSFMLPTAVLPAGRHDRPAQTVLRLSALSAEQFADRSGHLAVLRVQRIDTPRAAPTHARTHLAAWLSMRSKPRYRRVTARSIGAAEWWGWPLCRLRMQACVEWQRVRPRRCCPQCRRPMLPVVLPAYPRRPFIPTPPPASRRTDTFLKRSPSLNVPYQRRGRAAKRGDGATVCVRARVCGGLFMWALGAGEVKVLSRGGGRSEYDELCPKGRIREATGGRHRLAQLIIAQQYRARKGLRSC